MSAPRELPPIEDAPVVDERWLAVYVFYTGNPRPLLTTCIRSLFAELSAEKLISGYFFLNYWLEGPHVRVRFRLADPGAEAAVRERAEAKIGGFLRRRPSLYEVKSDFYVGLYNTLFDLEFTEEKRAEYLGADGKMRLRKNNSLSWERYEPEYDKYGGRIGVELAEWHFARSTDLVLDSMSVMNLHMRSVLLGYAGQLMMVMSSVFLDSDAEIAHFLGRYRDFWHSSFAETDLIAGRDFDRGGESMAESIARRFGTIRSAIRAGEHAQLPGSIGVWAAHCTELRARVGELAERGELVFPAWDGSGRVTVTDPAEARMRLLSAYLHMTNNRLHVTITDEAYLAHLLIQAVGNQSTDAAVGAG